jgi:hypothetical protein
MLVLGILIRDSSQTLSQASELAELHQLHSKKTFATGILRHRYKMAMVVSRSTELNKSLILVLHLCRL